MILDIETARGLLMDDLESMTALKAVVRSYDNQPVCPCSG